MVIQARKCPENIESGTNRDVLPPFGPKLCEVRATGLRMPADPQMAHFAEKSAKKRGKRGFGALGPRWRGSPIVDTVQNRRRYITKARENAKSNVIIVGLQEHLVENVQELMEVLRVQYCIPCSCSQQILQV